MVVTKLATFLFVGIIAVFASHDRPSFESFDKNGDGRISPEEFEQTLLPLLVSLTKFDEADTDHDGYITRKEAESYEDGFPSEFDKFDLDHDGKISREEFLLGIIEKLKLFLQKIFELMDRDHDGYISRAEYDAAGGNITKDARIFG